MISRLNREVREARRDRGQGEKPASLTSADDWPSPGGWARHEIYVEWTRRIAGPDKARYPLPSYDIGPDFVASLEALEEPQLRKAMKAAVDGLTGRAAHIAGRRLHPPRSGWGGDDPQVERSDGARAWRAAIESDTPSARRLHFWQARGGRIELSRVVLHDDETP